MEKYINVIQNVHKIKKLVSVDENTDGEERYIPNATIRIHEEKVIFFIKHQGSGKN